MQQAARCSDYTAYMYLGDLIEFVARDVHAVGNPRTETGRGGPVVIGESVLTRQSPHVDGSILRGKHAAVSVGDPPAHHGRARAARPVRLGQNNNQFVEVLAGVAEGEEVLLFQPPVGLKVDDTALAALAKEAGDKALASAGAAIEPVAIRPDAAAAADEGGGERGEGDDREGQKERDEGGDRPNVREAGFTVTPEMKEQFEKFRQMSPEEREAAFKKLQEDGKIPAGMPMRGDRPQGGAIEGEGAGRPDRARGGGGAGGGEGEGGRRSERSNQGGGSSAASGSGE